MSIIVRTSTADIMRAVRAITPPNAEELKHRGNHSFGPGLTRAEASGRVHRSWESGERKAQPMTGDNTAKRLSLLTGEPWAVAVGEGFAAAGTLAEMRAALGGGQ